MDSESKDQQEADHLQNRHNGQRDEFIQALDITAPGGGKEKMILETAFPEPPADNGVATPQDGTAYREIDQALINHILAGCSNQSAPGEDRMGAEIVKLLQDFFFLISSFCIQPCSAMTV